MARPPVENAAPHGEDLLHAPARPGRTCAALATRGAPSCGPGASPGGEPLDSYLPVLLSPGALLSRRADPGRGLRVPLVPPEQDVREGRQVQRLPRRPPAKRATRRATSSASAATGRTPTTRIRTTSTRRSSRDGPARARPAPPATCPGATTWGSTSGGTTACGCRARTSPSRSGRPTRAAQSGCHADKPLRVGRGGVQQVVRRQAQAPLRDGPGRRPRAEARGQRGSAGAGRRPPAARHRPGHGPGPPLGLPRRGQHAPAPAGPGGRGFPDPPHGGAPHPVRGPEAARQGPGSAAQGSRARPFGSRRSRGWPRCRQTFFTEAQARGFQERPGGVPEGPGVHRGHALRSLQLGDPGAESGPAGPGGAAVPQGPGH